MTEISKQIILSYDEYDTELVFDESSVCENILLQLYHVAENYSNKSIDRFLNWNLISDLTKSEFIDI